MPGTGISCKIKYPEILAPAGSLESLYAAVNAGCDAVYMGGSMFGARAYADNPDSSGMLHAIEYCHLHNVKLYMTVNTLLKDSEIENSLYNYIRPFYEAGLDAAVVQDTGVLYALHKWFPGLALHASTQMTITTGQAAALLREYGVTRIVPARELSLGELRQMRKNTNSEIEVFVHGALCYCYSGQCLSSSMHGERSGNRGRCAQPCRLPYYMDKKGTGEKSYILSMKELCALPYIGELIEAGVNSFKIEGRMKNPVYTAFVTSVYRKYVNLYMELGKDGYSRYIKEHREGLLYDMGQLAEVYNREGFTQGYLENKKEDMLASKRPKHGGVYVGEVIKTGNGVLEYRAVKDINAHDVIEFRDRSMRPLYEYTTGSPAKAGSIVGARFKKGCNIPKKSKVYRTKNSWISDDIKRKYIDNKKKVVINGRFEARASEKARLAVNKTCMDGCNVEAVVYGEPCQDAASRASGAEEVRKCLLQTGNTDFQFGHLETDIGDNLFLRTGMLKEMRREALRLLGENIKEHFRRKADKKFSREDIPGRDSIIPGIKNAGNNLTLSYKASVMTIPQLNVVLGDKRISEVYIKTELLDDNSIVNALSEVKKSGKKCYIVMPHIFRQNIWDYEEQRLKEGKSIYRAGFDGFVIRNFEEYVFLTGIADIAPSGIVTDTGLYIMNKYSYKFWDRLSVAKHTLPFELSLGSMGSLAAIPGMEAVIYTHVPLMVTAQCTSRNIKKGCKKESAATIYDGKGREFIIVNYCKYCYNTIYQGVPMSAGCHIKDLYNMGIRNFRYDFTIEEAWEVQDILSGKYSRETFTGHLDREVL